MTKTVWDGEYVEDGVPQILHSADPFPSRSPGEEPFRSPGKVNPAELVAPGRLTHEQKQTAFLKGMEAFEAAVRVDERKVDNERFDLLEKRSREIIREQTAKAHIEGANQTIARLEVDKAHGLRLAVRRQEREALRVALTAIVIRPHLDVSQLRAGIDKLVQALMGDGEL